MAPWQGAGWLLGYASIPIPTCCPLTRSDIAINGMYMVRPSEVEINAWHDIVAEDDEDGAQYWTWDALHKAMNKAETYSPPSSDIASLARIDDDSSVHGSDGPLHVSYPG